MKKKCKIKNNRIKRTIGSIKSILITELKLTPPIKYLVLIIAICSIAVIVVMSLSFNDNLSNNLYSEIIGSGIIACVVSILLLRLQNDDINKSNKSKAEQYFHKVVLPDIKEVFDEEINNGWELELNEEFYLSSTVSNKLYDIYKKNLDSVINFQSYNQDNVLLKSLDVFYLSARKTYIIGRHLDSIIRRSVRDAHFNSGIDQINDHEIFQIVRARIFIDGITDDQIVKNFSRVGINSSTQKIIDELNNDNNFKNKLLTAKTLRKASIAILELIKKSIPKT